jgi:hypothetical protein
MTEPQSQISQFLWKITDEFSPRIIVAESLILRVSMIGHSLFFINRLWLLSPIKFISSQILSERESIQSVVIEDVSKLQRIEAKAFQTTNLEFVKIPVSVAFLGEKCFSHWSSLSSITFKSESMSSRIEAAHSIELVWLKSFACIG